MQREAVQQILSLLPDTIGCFQVSEYPAPVRSALLGDEKLEIAALRAQLSERQDGDIKDILEPLLLAAEQVEAAQDDKAEFFITDLATQGMVFTGSKWRAGWALVLGGDDQQELIQKLIERSFMVFTDLPGIPETRYIGSRPTSPIYFLQIMVRYGMIWGRVAPGDDHELGHFLEKDMPGLIIIRQDLPPLKYLITLGLMKLGAPAVVPSTFPFPYGYRVVADTIPEILERGSQFPNLRQRYYEDEVISLPAPCNPALAHERFEVDRRFGGTADSFLCVRPVPSTNATMSVTGKADTGIGISIEIAAEHFSDDIAFSVEKTTLKAVNYLPGVHAYEERGMLYLDMAAGAALDEAQIRDAIYWGIRLEYPRLKDIAVNIIHDPARLHAMAPGIQAYRERRERLVAQMNEQNTNQFCACIECRPFSLVHTCILTPGRMPMCGSRTYSSVKAGALFGSNQVPWKRPSEKDLPMRSIFEKGRVLDPLRGEYEGVDAAYRELTHGQLQRVYLHSVREYPVTSCGCFQALAFWLPGVNGIAVMSRKSPSTAPDGSTWEMLANRAGGKQTPGIAGVSLQYIHSPDFLRGDGGMANVVWVDSELYEKIRSHFLPEQKVATERAVSTMADLRQFVGR